MAVNLDDLCTVLEFPFRLSMHGAAYGRPMRSPI